MEEKTYELSQSPDNKDEFFGNLRSLLNRKEYSGLNILEFLTEDENLEVIRMNQEWFVNNLVPYLIKASTNSRLHIALEDEIRSEHLILLQKLFSNLKQEYKIYVLPYFIEYLEVSSLELYKFLELLSEEGFFKSLIAKKLASNWETADHNELLEIQRIVNEATSTTHHVLGLEFMWELGSISTIDQLEENNVWKQIKAYQELKANSGEGLFSNSIAKTLASNWEAADHNELLEIQRMVTEVTSTIDDGLARQLIHQLKSIFTVNELESNEVWKQANSNK